MSMLGLANTTFLQVFLGCSLERETCRHGPMLEHLKSSCKKKISGPIVHTLHGNSNLNVTVVTHIVIHSLP